MVDVDHFKGVNDRLGHDGGDHVLREVAAAPRRVARPEDVAGRWGGEEFLVVCRAATGRGGAMGERIRAPVAAEPVTADRLDRCR